MRNLTNAEIRAALKDDDYPPESYETHEVVHACPAAGTNVTSCCGKTPFELPRYHRLTLDSALVTCSASSPTPL
jgi:hypothetical protein